MKFAIFCCLLGFCVFQVVQATFESKLEDLHKKAVKQITNHVQPTKNSFQELLVQAKQAKRSTDHCEVNSAIKTNVDATKNLLQKCVDKAHKSKKIEKAQNCFDITVNLGKNGLDMLVDQAKMCFASLPSL